MSIDCSDILFEFFFLPESSITWQGLDCDLVLGVCSAEQAAHQALLEVESTQAADQDTRYPVAVSLELDADLVFNIQAISISDLGLGVEKSGWTDSRLDLVLNAADVTAGYQMLMTVREEDRFTN